MPRLTEALGGPRLFIKRDDLTGGTAAGGNKIRKLEFAVADAMAKGADTLITTGGYQSNHARGTAAAAAKFGLGCILVLGGSGKKVLNGNLLLHAIMGAQVRLAVDRDRAEVMEEVVEEERAAGHKPYVIPLGASYAVGAAGYVAAMEELMGQLAEQDLKVARIVFGSSSGGTQAGLVVGAKALGFSGTIEAISIDQTESNLKVILGDLAPQTAAHLGLDLAFTSDDFIIYIDYLGGGYGVMGELEREAISLLARTEGILLDPVYTGRAFGGMIDLIRRGVFSRDETIVFWHTGGTQSLFAYADELLVPTISSFALTT